MNATAQAKRPNVVVLPGGSFSDPCLALRQFGRARRAGPHEMLISHISFEFQVDNDELHRRFIWAWDRIHKADTHELGPKTYLPMESYYRWVRIRAQKLGVPPTVLHPQIPTDVDTLKRSWAQLQEERDSYRERFNEQEQKIQKLTKQLENERDRKSVV